MKQIASIVLVLLMTLQCFYKLGVITYFNINRDYIAKELCVNKKKPGCHGQCFLKIKLGLIEKSEANGASAPNTKQTIELPLFLISQISFGFDKESPPCKWSSQYSPGFSLEHSTPVFRPPSLL